METVIVARDGQQSVAGHTAEMQTWLAAHNIVARELKMLHVLKFRLVFRATFDSASDAGKFAKEFG